MCVGGQTPEIRDKIIKSMNINSPQFNLCTGKALSKLNYQNPKESEITLQPGSRPIPNTNLKNI